MIKRPDRHELLKINEKNKINLNTVARFYDSLDRDTVYDRVTAGRVLRDSIVIPYESVYRGFVIRLYTISYGSEIRRRQRKYKYICFGMSQT